MKWFLLVFLAVFSGISTASEKKIVCHYKPQNKFGIDDINPFLCTHLIYGTFGIYETGELRIPDPNFGLDSNGGQGNFRKFNALKKLNPNLKTLIAIGDQISSKYSAIAEDVTKTQRFVTSVRTFLLKYEFDGLDFIWIYPGLLGGRPTVDKTYYTNFLLRIRTEFNPYKLLLAVDVAPHQSIADQSYNIPEIIKHVDFINIMPYNQHEHLETVASLNTPLYASEVDVTALQKQTNTIAIINYWQSKGAPASKLLLGLSFYGHTYTLAEPNKTAPGSPSIGPGITGSNSNTPGLIFYNELCDKLKSKNWTVVWNDAQKVPYAFKDYQWIGYDDLSSIEHKTKYADRFNLSGVMVTSLFMDDYRGICGEIHPLLRMINSIIRPEYIILESFERPTAINDCPVDSQSPKVTEISAECPKEPEKECDCSTAIQHLTLPKTWNFPSPIKRTDGRPTILQIIYP